MKKILLFGSGFIAANLVEYFYSKGSEVECAVVFNKTKIDTCHDIPQYPMSESVGSLFRKEQPDCLIILHGNSYVPDNERISDSISENLFRAVSFLEDIWAQKLTADLKKILVIGSASEYGPQYFEAIREDFPLHPSSVYGLSKICLYNAAQLFVNRGLPIIYARQFNAVGPSQRADFVLPSFLKALAAIEKGQRAPIMKVGDLSQERDFIDVRDVCRAYELILERGMVGGVYNVASGEYVSIDRLLRLAIEASTIDPNELTVEQNRDMFLGKEKLSMRLHADISKLIGLGFKCQYQLEQTIRDTLDYWRAHV